jgi:aryl-alcohol dehydrogenase-like predicted oxidoreductase
MLTGKYTRGEKPSEGTRMAAFGERGKKAMSDDNFDKVDRLTNFAETRGQTILTLAMSWLANLSYVPSVIAGATKVAQVKQNAAAAGWLLSEEELREIDQISK